MATLAELLVRLGVDDAQFNQKMKNASKTSKAFGADLDSVGTRLGVIATAGAAAAAGIGLIVSRQADAIASYKDLGQKIGDSAANVSKLKTASDVSGTALDEIAKASVRLTATLAKQDEDSKGAAQALKALGLNFEQFKTQSPVQQLETLADRFAMFEDGAGKTAGAVQLFGKSGADLLPLMDELADKATRFAKVTNEQSDEADQFGDRLKRMGSDLSTLSQQYSSVLIPVLDDTVKAFAGVTKQVLEARDAQGRLVGQDAIREWAQDGAIAAAILAESLVGVIKLAGSLVSTLGLVVSAGGYAVNALGANLGLVNNAEAEKSLAALGDSADKFSRRWADLWNYNGTALSDALRKQFAELDNANRKLAAFDPLATLKQTLGDTGPLIFRPEVVLDAAPEYLRRLDPPKKKPKLDLDLTGNKGGAAAEAIRKSVEELNRYIEAEDAARKTLAEMDTSLRDQIATFGMSEEAVLAYRLSVGDLSEEVARAGPLGTEYAKSITEQAARLRAATAAQDAFNNALANERDLQASGRQFERQLSDIGAGPVARRYSAGVNNIEDQVTQRTQGVEDRRNAGQIDQSQYEQQLQAITLFQTDALAQWDKYFGALETRNADFSLQFNDALLGYVDGLRNVGGLLGGDLTSAFESATAGASQLAAQSLLWGEGGAEAAKALARDLITQTASAFIQAGIRASAFYALQKAGIVSTTAVSTAAQATTASTAVATNATIAASAAPAAALSSLASFGSNAIPAAIGIALVSGAIGALLGGAFEDGGSPPLGKLSLVGEGGPELFVPKTAGTILPADITQRLLSGQSFEVGGRPPVGLASLVGESGRELFVPDGSLALNGGSAFVGDAPLQIVINNSQSDRVSASVSEGQDAEGRRVVQIMIAEALDAGGAFNQARRQSGDGPRVGRL